MSWIDALRRISGVSRISRQIHASPPRAHVAPYYQPATEVSLIAVATFFSVIFAFVGGYYLAIFKQYFISYLFIVIVPLLALTLWSTPDTRGMRNHALRAYFLATVASLILWPNYLAIAVPGLPWMALSRLLLFICCILFLISIAFSAQNRGIIRETLQQHPIMRTLLLMFLAIQLVTLPFSTQITESINHLFNTYVYWIFVFFISLIVFQEEKAVVRWSQILCLAAFVLCVITVREVQLGKVLWAGHIPSFLQIDDPVIERIMAGRFRAGEYRVKATFMTSLSYAEFLVLVVPFVMSRMMNAKRLIMRFVFAAFIIFMIWAIIATGSRLGMIGLAITILGYALLWGIRRRNLRRADLLGPTVVMLYPALLMLFSVAVLSSNRLHVMFIGGGEHKASNEAREVMMARGIPMILKNPIGHGPGRGGQTLGYTNPSGQLTIDNYFLNIGLEYGIIGLISFFGLIIGATYIGVRTYLTSRRPDAEYAGAAALALGAYFVIKTVLSGTQNQSIMFMLIAMVLAISYRHSRIDAQPGRHHAPEPQVS